MAGTEAARRRTRRRMAGSALALCVALWASRVVPYLSALLPMLTTWPVHRLPSWYVAGQADCASLPSTFVPDPWGYVRDPTTGQPAQTAVACEDARLLSHLGLFVLSCDPGRVEWNTFMGLLTHAAARGALWVVPSTNTQALPQRVPLLQWPTDSDFHPLGLGVYEQAPGQARLFVVNQRALFTTIEVLDLVCEHTSCYATYVRTIAHPHATHTANSVHPVSPHAVLVSNSHLLPRRAPPRAQYVAALATRMPLVLARALYFVVRLPWLAPWLAKADAVLRLGWVAHVSFDDTVRTPREDAAQYAQGVHTHLIAKQLGFANGLAVTPDDGALVVASSMYLGTYIYPLQAHDRHGRANWTSPHVLGARQWAPTPFLPDNVAIVPRQPGTTWAPDDPLHGASVLVAGHPSVPALERMVHDASMPAPSWVVQQSHRHPAGPNDAPTVPWPAQRALLAGPQWHVRTVLQTQGQAVAASAGAVWDPTHHVLLVLGLYGSPLVCHYHETSRGPAWP